MLDTLMPIVRLDCIIDRCPIRVDGRTKLDVRGNKIQERDGIGVLDWNGFDLASSFPGTDYGSLANCATSGVRLFLLFRSRPPT